MAAESSDHAVAFANHLRQLAVRFELVIKENQLLRQSSISTRASSADTEDRPEDTAISFQHVTEYDAAVAGEKDQVKSTANHCDACDALRLNCDLFKGTNEIRQTLERVDGDGDVFENGNGCDIKATETSGISFASESEDIYTVKHDHDGCNSSDDEKTRQSKMVLGRQDSKASSSTFISKNVSVRLRKSQTNVLMDQILNESTSDDPENKKHMRWYNLLRTSVWNFWEMPDACLRNQVFHFCYNMIIVGSVCSPIAASTNISDEAREGLSIVDLVFTVIFTAEVLLKILSCPNLRSYLTSSYTLIDVVVVIAGYLNLAFAGSRSPFLQLLGTQMPILRLLKITRHSSKWRLLLFAIRGCAAALLVPIYLLLLMVVFSGSLHYWIDQNYACNPSHGVCELDTEPAFESIPHAMWFVLVTIATVGYGDLVPHTVPGKILASFQIMMGVFYMAMPITIVGANFSKVWQERFQFLIRDKLLNSSVKLDISKMRRIFDVFDEGEGTITEEAFVLFLEGFQLDLSKSGIQELFSAIDADGSGQISFEEFIEFVYPEQSMKQEHSS